LSGSVSETAPTASTKVPGATVTITAGSNAGKNTTTDASGNYFFQNLSTGALTLRATASGYQDGIRDVTLTSDQSSIVLAINPVPQTRTGSADDSISGGDTQCQFQSLVNTPCKVYGLYPHNSGLMTATLTWTDTSTGLWLGLYRNSDRSTVVEAFTFKNTQNISANIQGGQIYTLAVEWCCGARVTPFHLDVSWPN
jgi:hypothetical protein